MGCKQSPGDMISEEADPTGHASSPEISGWNGFSNSSDFLLQKTGDNQGLAY